MLSDHAHVADKVSHVVKETGEYCGLFHEVKGVKKKPLKKVPCPFEKKKKKKPPKT